MLPPMLRTLQELLNGIPDAERTPMQCSLLEELAAVGEALRLAVRAAGAAERVPAADAEVADLIGQAVSAHEMSMSASVLLGAEAWRAMFRDASSGTEAFTLGPAGKAGAGGFGGSLDPSGVDGGSIGNFSLTGPGEEPPFEPKGGKGRPRPGRAGYVGMGGDSSIIGPGGDPPFDPAGRRGKPRI